MWGPKQFLVDLELFGSVKAVCKFYAQDEVKWRGLYGDAWRWKNPKSPDYDPEFAAEYGEWCAKHAPRAPKGRKKKLAENPNWREEYRAAIVRFNGNRVKAAEVTPYTFETLQKMCRVGWSEYDEELQRQTDLADLELSAKAEEALNNALDSAAAALEMDDLEVAESKAKVAQVIGNLADKITKKMDRKRWSDKIDINHTGTISHRALPPGREIEMLMEERQKYMEAKAKQLSSGNVIDVEAVLIPEVQSE